jgi:phosphonate transport system permease protein
LGCEKLGLINQKQENRFKWIPLLLCLALLLGSFYIAGLGREKIFNADGISQAITFFQAAFKPDLSPDFVWLTFQAAAKTLAYGGCSTFFSLIIGFIVAVCTCELMWEQNGAILSIIRSILAIPRSIHEAIWGLMLVNIIGLDPLVAILAITIPYSAIIGKVFAEILDETPREPFYALVHSGIHPLKAMLYTILPQSATNLLSYGCYRFECSIRSAVVLGIIGAGGLGYELLLSWQSLRYSQMWTLILAQLFLTSSTDLWSRSLRRLIGAPSRIALNQGTNDRGSNDQRTNVQGDIDQIRTLTKLLPNSQNRQKLDLAIASTTVIMLVIFAIAYVQADLTKLWSESSWANLSFLIQEMNPPNWALTFTLFPDLVSTLAMSIIAIALAGTGGIILAFGTVRTQNFSKGSWIRIWLIRILLLIGRTIPEPIWAVILMFVLFPGILPGALALAIHNLGILGKLMAEAIENLDTRPTESLTISGASGAQSFLYSTLPQTMPGFIAYSLYRWEVCLRSTIIVGYVGAGGLGRVLTEQLSSFDYRSLVITILIIVAMTLTVDRVSGSLRKALRS